MLLNMIEKYSSIINLIKLGYSYTDVINYYKELTEKDLIKTDENSYKILTKKGKELLKEYKKKFADYISGSVCFTKSKNDSR